MVISNQKPNIDFNGNFPIIHVRLEAEGDNRNVLMAVMHFGCQIFVLNVENYTKTLCILEETIKKTDQRFGRRKLLFIPSAQNSTKIRKQYIQVIKLPVLQFIPDVLFIVPNDNCNNAKNTNLNNGSLKIVQSITPTRKKSKGLPFYNIIQNNNFRNGVFDERMTKEVHYFISAEADNCNCNFELFTHQFIGISNNSSPYVIDYWNCLNKKFRNDNNLFPDKMANFYGKKLRIATFNYHPYSVIDGDTLDGTEMRLGLEYAKKINGTIDMLDDEENEWGIIEENATGNGILGNLVEDRADIGFGALYTWFHEYGFLDLSLPVIRSGVTCLTPAPRLLTSWLTTVLPFTWLVWAMLISTNFVIVLGFKLISKYNYGIRYLKIKNSDFDVSRNNSSKFSTNFEKGSIYNNYSILDSILLIIGLNVLQPFPYSLDRFGIAFKHLLVYILLLSLLVTCSYSGGLATTLTLPRFGSSIKTLQDLADSGMNWGATHDAWIFSILETKQPLIRQIRNQFRVYSENKLHLLSKTRNFSFSIERLPFGHFAIGSYLTQEQIINFQVMQEDIYWEQCVFMMRKSSPHLEGINTLIGYTHASGLMSYWEEEVSRKYMNYKVQFSVKLSETSNKNNDESSPVQLRTSHLKGLYLFWIFGVFISFLAFLSELIHDYLQKRNILVSYK